MRDLHLRHTLKTLARDAAAVFTDLVESGQEIPYEIAEPGDSFAFCQYQPLSAKFVRDNAAELRELGTFAEAVETMRGSEVAGTYLQEAGIAPPADPVERATLAVTYFLARLWDGCSDFELDEDRFSAVLTEVEDCSEPEAGEVEAIVPLIGFQMDATRIEMKGAAIVRADTVDVPPEAARSDRPGPGEWEPTFVISARVQLDDDGGLAGAGERVAAVFERVVSTLRLHRSGGVGLGPHGWVRVAGDRWRRIATGAARPRSGGYRLAEDEIPDLVDLARTVSVHPRRVTRMRRAMLRFESGLDRRGAVDALNDHLLGLRFLLEGEGPAGVGLPMRVAALSGEGADRDEVKYTIESAIALERELWSGEPSKLGASTSEVAVRVESLLRTILRRAVSGELGADLRAAADETLLADGLALGAGAAGPGSAAEWDLEPAEEEPETYEHRTAEAFERFERDPEPQIAASRPADLEPETTDHSFVEPEVEPERAVEPATVAAEAEREELTMETELNDPDDTGRNNEAAGLGRRPATEHLDAPDWLEEVDEGRGKTMDFPQRSNRLDDLAKPPMDRKEVKARVEYLFPRTETEWAVGQKTPRRQARAG